MYIIVNVSYYFYLFRLIFILSKYTLFLPRIACFWLLISNYLSFKVKVGKVSLGLCG